MKKLLISTFCSFAVPAIAQEGAPRRHEISVGYGFFGTSQMVSVFSEPWPLL